MRINSSIACSSRKFSTKKNKGSNVGRRIVSFTGKYWFLSVDFPHFFTYGNNQYMTAYHAYLCASAANPADRKAISAIENVNVLRFVVSRKIKTDLGWPDQREAVMRDILQAKFSDSTMATMLVSTDGLELVNTLDYDDKFWGVFRNNGRNILGSMLMELRDELCPAKS